MCGVDRHKLGFGKGVILTQLSPLHTITLPAELRWRANIPFEAKYFAFVYPPERFFKGESKEHLFLQHGGFVYFDPDMKVLSTNFLARAGADSASDLKFGRAQDLPRDVRDALQRQGRFQDVPRSGPAAGQAGHFAWIRPGEFKDYVGCPDGAFAYILDDTRQKYFPIVQERVFSPELLTMVVHDQEAWVTLRTQPPTIERIFLFQRDEDFAVNAENVGYNTVAADKVLVRRGGTDLSYEEWQKCTEPGSVVDPWVMELSAR